MNLIQESEGKKGIEGNWPCKDEEETRGTLPGERIKEESHEMGQRPLRARRSQRGWTEALCVGTIMELGGGYE